MYKKLDKKELKFIFLLSLCAFFTFLGFYRVFLVYLRDYVVTSLDNIYILILFIFASFDILYLLYFHTFYVFELYHKIVKKVEFDRKDYNILMEFCSEFTSIDNKDSKYYSFFMRFIDKYGENKI